RRPRRSARQAALALGPDRGALPPGRRGGRAEGQSPRPKVPGGPQEGEGLARPAEAPLRLRVGWPTTCCATSCGRSAGASTSRSRSSRARSVSRSASRTCSRARPTPSTTGMLFDLARFPGEDAASLAALDTLDELDRYTYLVAGCVGPFWTALHAAHRPRLRRWDLRQKSQEGVSFGKALQMTNVLRDIPSDLRHGRCYLPAADLGALGLVPKDLLEPGAGARVRPLYRRLLATALAHYDVACRYTLAIPRREWRMRLACAWPLLI